MKIGVCALFPLLALSNAVVLNNSIIITSADVKQGEAQPQTGLSNGVLYRVYGTFASGGGSSNYAYALNVWVRDTLGVSYSVAQLAAPKYDSGCILDETKFLRAPITVTDQNKGAQVPFTIYMVDASVEYFPVASAQLALGAVDLQPAFWAAGVTVLSAEKYFTMFDFDIGAFPSVYISSVGYDEFSPDYRIMYIGSQKEARISFLTVYGPIATLSNTNFASNRFFCLLSINTPYVDPIAHGASFAFLSPGYLSQEASYNIPYTVTEAFNRAYTFDDSNWMHAGIQAQGVSPASIQLRFTSSGGDNRDVVSTTDVIQDYGEAYGNRISLSVKTNGGPSPRFLYKITSGSALSFSLLGMLLVALFSKF